MSSRRTFLTGSTAVLGLPAITAAVAGSGQAAASVAAPKAGDTEAGRPPSFVVVLADDLGYGELGSYGQKLISTPRLDRLAAEGMRFTDAYSTAAVCAPSRCSLLTGLHTGHSTVRANPSAGGQGSLTATDTTFAQVLRARGYRTAVIGKWGFGPETAGQESHPAARGFEEFYGYITHGHAHEYYPEYLWHNNAKESIPANAGGAKAVYAPDLLEQRALEFIDTHADEPFLLLLTPNVPHAPSDVPDTSAYADRGWSAANTGHAARSATSTRWSAKWSTGSAPTGWSRTRSSSSPATTAPTRRAGSTRTCSTRTARCADTSATSTRAAYGCPSSPGGPAA